MRRILFQETDFESLPNPPAGFKYIGFDGPNFTEKDDTGVSSPAGGSGGLTEITHSQIRIQFKKDFLKYWFYCAIFCFE